MKCGRTHLRMYVRGSFGVTVADLAVVQKQHALQSLKYLLSDP